MTQTFDLAEILAAIETTSTGMTEMTERIAALEAANYRLDEQNSRLRAELAEMITLVEAAKSVSSAATRDADRADATAESHRHRVERMQADLNAANDDLAKITAAVARLSRYA